MKGQRVVSFFTAVDEILKTEVRFDSFSYSSSELYILGGLVVRASAF